MLAASKSCLGCRFYLFNVFELVLDLRLCRRARTYYGSGYVRRIRASCHDRTIDDLEDEDTGPPNICVVLTPLV